MLQPDSLTNSFLQEGHVRINAADMLSSSAWIAFGGFAWMQVRPACATSRHFRHVFVMHV